MKKTRIVVSVLAVLGLLIAMQAAVFSVNQHKNGECTRQATTGLITFDQDSEGSAPNLPAKEVEGGSQQEIDAIQTPQENPDLAGLDSAGIGGGTIADGPYWASSSTGGAIYNEGELLWMSEDSK